MSAYSTAVLADSPDVYYRLDETGAGPLVDVVAAHNATANATIVSASSLVPMDSDAAVTLDYTGAFFKGTTAYTLAQQPMTVEFWINPTALTTNSGWPVVVSCTNNATNGWAAQYQVTTGLWTFTTCGVNDYAFTAAAVAGTTQHIVFVFKASNDVDLYVNGAFSQTISNATPMSATTGFVTIGDSQALGRNMRGTVDELAIYKSALSAVRIGAHYTAGTVAAASGHGLLLLGVGT